MTNFNIPNLPERTNKNRDHGLTIIQDDGTPIRKVGSLSSTIEPYADFVRFSPGAALIGKNLRDKVREYKNAHIRPLFDGTVFEIFQARNMVEEYIHFLNENGVKQIEISCQNISIDHEQKLNYIRQFCEAGFTVFSRIGNKTLDNNTPFSYRNWHNAMRKELDAGAWKIMAQPNTPKDYDVLSFLEADRRLAQAIQNYIDINDVVWEAPHPAQQTWFTRQLGVNVNLANININKVLQLEAKRLGLHPDTLDQYIVL